MALEETVLGSGAHTDCVPGRLGLGRLGRPTWVRVVSRAFLLRALRFGASLAHSGHHFGVALYACLSLLPSSRLTPGSFSNRYKTFKQKQGRFPSSREPPRAPSCTGSVQPPPWRTQWILRVWLGEGFGTFGPAFSRAPFISCRIGWGVRGNREADLRTWSPHLPGGGRSSAWPRGGSPETVLI